MSMRTIPITSVDGKRSTSPAEEMVVSPKRAKVHESTSMSSTIQRSELDSALALASLALNSPKQPVSTVPDDQNREAEVSPKTTDDDIRSAVPITPGSPQYSKRKRVHFSGEGVDPHTYPNPYHHPHSHHNHQTQSVATASRLIRRRKPMIVPHSRAVQTIPYNHPLHRSSMMPLPSSYRYPMMYRPWMPNHVPFPHQARHQLRHHMPPPPRPPPQSLTLTPSATKTWICDFCNSAAFETYQDACAHERMCMHHVGKPQTRQPEEKQISNDRENEDNSRDSESAYFSGCVPLSVESADAEWLSELNCYIRKHCIQAFSATKEDVLKTSKRGRIVFNQVGIRCKFCVHRPLRDKAVAAVSYPTSMAGIYESVKRWQRVHLPACMDVSDDMQAKLDQLTNDTVWVPTTRQYWTDSARVLGMTDTAEGIRFDRDPTIPPPSTWMPEGKKPEIEAQVVADVPGQSGGFICLPEDKEIIPPYVYFLMRQVEPCYFTEADRFVARSKGPVGFAGFQCRHCQGHAGLGKYFPLNSKALSTNSTSQNIHAHILKCRKSPQGVKEELIYLKTEKMKSPRLVPGWRKTFFEQIWERMHGDSVNLSNI